MFITGLTCGQQGRDPVSAEGCNWIGWEEELGVCVQVM